MSSLTLKSYAKINLGLQVQRKRPDGYHDIETVMQTLDLADTITITPQQSGITVTCTDPSVPTDGRNLVHQAVDLVREQYSKTEGVHVHLDKRIPVAAGLAGGSGNGAMTLLALNKLWNLNLSEKDLMALATQIGSDMPFCLYGGTAIARGRGEKLNFLELDCPGAFVLVNPHCSISSAWAYQHLKIELTNPQPFINLIVCALREGHISQLMSQLHNDLEQPVLEAYPVVDRVKRTLLDCGASGVLMSGSGSTVFGMTADIQTAESIASRIRKIDMQWRVDVVTPISRAEIVAQRGF